MLVEISIAVFAVNVFSAHKNARATSPGAVEGSYEPLLFEGYRHREFDDSL